MVLTSLQYKVFLSMNIDVFLCICCCFNLFQIHFVVFIVHVFAFLDNFIPLYFIIFGAIVNGLFSQFPF